MGYSYTNSPLLTPGANAVFHELHMLVLFCFSLAWTVAFANSALAAVTLFLPLQKLAEDRFALLRRKLGEGGAFVVEKF